MTAELSFEELPDGSKIITIQGINQFGEKYIRQERIKCPSVWDALKRLTYTAEETEAFAEWCLLNDGSTVVKIIKEQETYIKFLSDELKQKNKIIEAQDEYILYLREAIDRVYIHLKKPCKYYDAEFLLRGDMIRNKIEEAKNDR